MSAIEDVTAPDIDVFIERLQNNHLSRPDVRAIAVSLRVDDPSLDPDAMVTTYSASNGLLSFLCSAKPIVVNAVVNNILFGTVSAGKGVLLRDFLCSFVASNKENTALQEDTTSTDANAALDTPLLAWARLSQEEKKSVLSSWKDGVGAE